MTRQSARSSAVAALLGVAIIAAVAPAPATANADAQQAPAPRTNLADIEDEVMCPICGTTLGLSESPQAERERAFIQRLVNRGETKDEIKAALVAEYGQEVLAVPSDSGFDLAAWIVPAAGLAAAAIAIGLGLRRWRRRSPSQGDGGDGIDPADEERLRSDLARYDL